LGRGLATSTARQQHFVNAWRRARPICREVHKPTEMPAARAWVEDVAINEEVDTGDHAALIGQAEAAMLDSIEAAEGIDSRKAG